MDVTSFTTVITFCSLLWLPVCVSQDDCIYKECFCSRTIIMCSVKELQTFPQIVSPNVTGFQFLDIETNKIKSIPAGRLPPNLENINLNDNPVESIDDTAFDESAETLTTLYFSNTNLNRIPNALGHLHALTELHISGASIFDWNEAAMINLGHTLQTLLLENVGMTTWPVWLQNFTSLRVLTIAGSTISSLPDNGLDSMINSLTNLYLYNNSLTVVPKALSKLTNLQDMYLHQNQIHEVSYLPLGSKLSSLGLSDNKISDGKQLSNSLRPFANYLTSFDIYKNELSSIPDFSFLTKVPYIDLTYNKISDPTSGSLSYSLFNIDLDYNYLPSIPIILASLVNITDINLSHNTIKIIQASNFHAKTSSVDLSYNLITELSDTSFPENCGIMFLQLNNNPISHISETALSNLPNLFELNLRSSQLTRLPLALKALTKLSTFDISNSSNLICTCLENSLTDWFKNFRPSNVLGDCGHATVYIFFTTLSPSCPTQRDLLWSRDLAVEFSGSLNKVS